MTNPAYCSVIHGGLRLNLAKPVPTKQYCCLSSTSWTFVPDNLWDDNVLQKHRSHNRSGQWSSSCANCQQLEAAGLESMRTGMNRGFDMQDCYDLSGPVRLDLELDISCNLACRICSTACSTLWQKHLKEHGQWSGKVFSPIDQSTIYSSIDKLDLSNLQLLLLSGGETLMSQLNWDVANYVADRVPQAKNKLMLNLQTNGTQPVQIRNYATIEKFKLVRFNISLDGVGSRFEYLRWPANWASTVDNIFTMRERLPSNVMFLIEETVCALNLFYIEELRTWAQNNFTTNREGDEVVHSRHLALYTHLNITDALTQEYVDAMADSPFRYLIAKDWQEKPEKVREMIATVEKFDGYRNQDWRKTFPEVAEFYHRYL